MRIEVVAILAAAAASSVQAGVTAIGEFAGEAYETFENVAPPGTYPSPFAIFNGNVTVHDTLAQIFPITFVFNGPSGEVLPFDGNLMGATVAGTSVFQFSTAVTRFGGWINTVSPVGGGTAVFRDSNGTVIDTLSFSNTPIEWTWVGWESDIAISTIEMTGTAGPGFGFQFDNLTLNYVPAPGAATLLGLGALGAIRRRR